MNDAFKTSLSMTTTGATAATGILECAVGRKRGGGIQLTGTFTGTVQFEETLDSGTTWITKTVYPVSGGAGVTSATATGTWKFACGGSTNFRVRCSAFTSGPIVVDITLTEGVDTGIVDSGSGSGSADSVALTKASVTMSGASAALVAASAARAVVLVSNASANAAAAVDPTGGTAALDAGMAIPPGQTVIFTGKAAQSAMTQIGTNTQKLTVYTG
jgi:hypothetical protein